MSVKTKDPYEEVKKLQNLVQKLEHQNEQLKSQCNKGNKNDRRSKSFSVADNGIQTKLLNFNFDNEKNRMNPNMEELIDVDGLELSDDDSWLYTPPKGLTTEDAALSPYKWLRKDLEDPENKELQLAKSALIDKLEELSILSSSNQTQNTEEQQDENKNVPNDEVSLEQPRVIDTRTFTRSKKKKISREEEVESKDLPVIEPVIITNGRNGDIDDDSTNYEYGYIRPELYQLSDFIDVHEKARMQEESLRLSTTIIPPRGSSSLPRVRKLQNSRTDLLRNTSSDTEDSFNNNSHNVKQNNVQRPMTSTPTMPAQRYFSSMHSNPSRFNNTLNVKVPSSLRHSLPNLAKGNTNRRPSPTKSINNSSSSMSNHSVSSNQRQSLQVPTKQLRRESAPNAVYRTPAEANSYSANVTSIHNLQNSHRSTPSLTAHAQGRSGLPRPSKLPAPRPRLPVPTYQHKKSHVDESWSDGCF